jgi:hypothetical protein
MQVITLDITYVNLSTGHIIYGGGLCIETHNSFASKFVEFKLAFIL